MLSINIRCNVPATTVPLDTQISSGLRPTDPPTRISGSSREPHIKLKKFHGEIKGSIISESISNKIKKKLDELELFRDKEYAFYSNKCPERVAGFSFEEIDIARQLGGKSHGGNLFLKKDGLNFRLRVMGLQRPDPNYHLDGLQHSDKYIMVMSKDEDLGTEFHEPHARFEFLDLLY